MCRRQRLDSTRSAGSRLRQACGLPSFTVPRGCHPRFLLPRHVSRVPGARVRPGQRQSSARASSEESAQSALSPELPLRRRLPGDSLARPSEAAPPLSELHAPTPACSAPAAHPGESPSPSPRPARAPGRPTETHARAHASLRAAAAGQWREGELEGGSASRARMSQRLRPSRTRPSRPLPRCSRGSLNKEFPRSSVSSVDSLQSQVFRTLKLSELSPAEWPSSASRLSSS